MLRDPGWERLLARADLRIVAPARTEGPALQLDSVVRRTGLARFLAAAARARLPVTLVVNDPHRGTETRAILDAVVRMADGLKQASRFRLLVATGSHSFDATARHRHEAIVLGRLGDRFKMRAWHDARDPRCVARVGRFRIHRWVARSRFVLAIGSLEPHYFAGVTGAHKTLTIGVMAERDIEANHVGALKPAARPLVLRDNPVFDGIACAVRALERSGHRLFCLNAILSRGQIVGCTGGRPLLALRAGLPLVRRVFAPTLPAPFDLIVARVEPPLNRNLYQAEKGIKNVEGAVVDGGVIILDAGCREGVGMDRFLQLLQETDDDAAAKAMVARRGYRLGDHKAVRLRLLTERRRVRLGVISRTLPPEVARALHAVRFARRDEAARWAIDLLRSRGDGHPLRALVVQDAGSVIPTVRERRAAGRRRDRMAEGASVD